MFEQVAEAYDVVHAGRGKDYGAEAARVTDEIRRRRPGAVALLDVACGTGGHLRFLREAFDDVEGLDASGAMLERARAAAPGIPLHVADMRTFDLPRRFDAVVCLFSSVGYLVPLDEMRRGVANMARHLAPGGVVVIEPWILPGDWRDATVVADAGNDGRTAVARASRSWSEEDGRVSRIEMRWAIATAGRIDVVTEQHRLGLYTSAEYEDALGAAGCAVDHDPEGLIGRGLFIGTRAS